MEGAKPDISTLKKTYSNQKMNVQNQKLASNEVRK